MNHTKHKSALLAVLLSFSLIAGSIIPYEPVFASVSKVSEPQAVSSFNSCSNSSMGDLCRGTVSGSTLQIAFQTQLPAVEFRISLYGVTPQAGSLNLGIYMPAGYKGYTSSGNRLYGFDCTIDFTELDVPDGEYFLYISRRKSLSDTYESTPSKGALYKNLYLKVENGIPSILQYTDVIKENKSVQDTDGLQPGDYLDNTLTDVRFLLVDPVTKIRDTMTADKISFIRSLSARITAGAGSNYNKLLKIYEYVAGNFYYDTLAFSTHSNQYANPYQNLYNHEHCIASANSDSSGRVATTCQGFAGMYLALARAQGIPTRLVFGRRAASPSYSWSNEQNITVRDHWWAESYVDGRWITVDPTVGTNNRWYKNSNLWQYYGLTNYTYFDPSEQQLAVSHLSFSVYKNLYAGCMVSNQNEITKLTSFLETRYGSLSNGMLMNSGYISSDKKTWGDGNVDNFYGNGSGRTAKIIWSGYGLNGNADFSGFSKLKTLFLQSNNLISLNLKEDTLLKTVDVTDNQIETINLSNCKNLTSVHTEGNKLKKAVIYANKRNVTISSSGNGYFYIVYDSSKRYKLRTFFKADIGYKLDGFYNVKKGKKLTSLGSYSMNPLNTSYRAVFVLDPDSYKLTLSQNRNYGEYKDYNKAAQKRLKELGYYSGTEDGYFGYNMYTAVKAFQAHCLLTVSGEIDEVTWSKLFSDNPEPDIETVSDDTSSDENQTVTSDSAAAYSIEINADEAGSEDNE